MSQLAQVKSERYLETAERLPPQSAHGIEPPNEARSRGHGCRPAIVVTNVSKAYSRQGRPRTGTLKSLLTRDIWRRRDSQAPSARTQALADVTLSVLPGQTVGIVGRNGSGKSTLLKILAGILKADTGTTSVRGRVAALIELGAGFHPELTGRENVVINGVILGLSKREIMARMDEIIAFAELENFIDEPVRTYSSGMYMRLGFAVAVSVDPEILLLDEVLAVGDLAFTNKCKERMNRFKQEGKTIVLVSHDVVAVSEWCDAAVWLDQGSVRAEGTAQAVAEAFASELR